MVGPFPEPWIWTAVRTWWEDFKVVPSLYLLSYILKVSPSPLLSSPSLPGLSSVTQRSLGPNVVWTPAPHHLVHKGGKLQAATPGPHGLKPCGFLSSPFAGSSILPELEVLCSLLQSLANGHKFPMGPIPLLERLHGDLPLSQIIPSPWSPPQAASELHIRKGSSEMWTEPKMGQSLSNRNAYKNIVLSSSTYSLDLPLFRSWLFLKLKITTKDKCFELIQATEVAMPVQSKTLTNEDFQNCFWKWQEWWNEGVWSEGLFEGH